MKTLSKTEIENIALKVAAILKDRVDGDAEDYWTWVDAANGICDLKLYTRSKTEGFCAIEILTADAPPEIHIVAYGNRGQSLHLARTLIHELTHAVLFHFAAEVFTNNPFVQYDYTYQAAENIARAVERYFLGSFGRGWLPMHSLYWH